jgi:hypothetical protein
LVLPEGGLPTALVRAFIDNILVHGPTFEKTALVMQALMNKELDIGLLFSLTKITPLVRAVASSTTGSTFCLCVFQLINDSDLSSFSSSSWTARTKIFRDW